VGDRGRPRPHDECRGHRDGDGSGRLGGPDRRVEQSNAIDGAAVERALAPLGVAEHDIEVENPIDLSFASSASPYVRVHLSVGALRAKGKQILAAVKRFVPGDAAGSVVFASSRCTQVLAQAQRAAVADAGKRIDSLAAAAHVHLGGVAGVSGNPSTELYLPGADACRPDLDLLVGTGLLSGAASFSGVPVPVAVDLDAPARITETVSIDVARAIT
jgi:hypothetical protein